MSYNPLIYKDVLLGFACAKRKWEQHWLSPLAGFPDGGADVGEGASMVSRNATEMFIAAQRSTLDRLELFRRTPGYARLLTTLQRSPGGDVEAWLAAWLIEPSTDVGGMPVDVAAEPGGLAVLVDHLESLGNGAYG
jgi:hypothetical protein